MKVKLKQVYSPPKREVVILPQTIQPTYLDRNVAPTLTEFRQQYASNMSRPVCRKFPKCNKEHSCPYRHPVVGGVYVTKG